MTEHEDLLATLQYEDAPEKLGKSGAELASSPDADEQPGPIEQLRDDLEARGVLEVIQEQAVALWTREEAKRVLQVVRNGQLPSPSSTPLPVLLAEPDDGEVYLIDRLWPQGGNIVLSAQYKTGKTTLVNNLVRSLADWDPFLEDQDRSPEGDSFDIKAPLLDGETVFVADLELPRRAVRRWLGEQNIQHPEKVNVESFRGRVGELDITDPDRRAEWAQHLRSLGTRVLIIDPLAALLNSLGLDENSNSEVGPVLDAIGSLGQEAGIGELMVVHHAGHVQERSRGASRLRDWPDAEWRLVREAGEGNEEPPPDAARFLIAEGRDVAVPETKLAFNALSKRLSVAGGNRTQHKATKDEPLVLDAIKNSPGISARDLRAALHEAGVGSARADKAIQAAVRGGEVHTWQRAKNTAKYHALSDDCGTPSECPGAKEAGLS